MMSAKEREIVDFLPFGISAACRGVDRRTDPGKRKQAVQRRRNYRNGTTVLRPGGVVPTSQCSHHAWFRACILRVEARQQVSRHRPGRQACLRRVKVSVLRSFVYLKLRETQTYGIAGVVSEMMRKGDCGVLVLGTPGCAVTGIIRGGGKGVSMQLRL